MNIEPKNNHVKRVADSLNSLMTHASRIGTIKEDTLLLLRGYLANFIQPEIIIATADILTIDYRNKVNQLPRNSLVVGNDTLDLISEFEDEIHSTLMGDRFYDSVRLFYETVVSKMLAKFPHRNDTLSDLVFLNPRNRTHCCIQSITRLCKQFMTTTSEEIDQIIQEFVAYKITPDNQLPLYNSTDIAAIDHFWSAMSSLEVVTSVDLSDSPLAYSNLSKLSKILLTLPHSNADPERLFSMVKKLRLIPVLY
ncbi:hypothetical protein LOD99_11897 [Oopsacas minuta]|uniref:HAT C-terminal dimerisation domain-containing protein n=1 Tax=Oopsacas minuta TaxID=111878 RepID=A0AAV7JGU1_9METZ|nr:hypothetical protein LOD99_11897 [Oopsacas minuta]